MSVEISPSRKLFAPEVIQTSTMDCGPASLKCLLEGYRISVSYGRLREACQTDVDGTSIDTMEKLAMDLGLESEQVMVPADHVALSVSDDLPAIVVVQLPSGLTHFVVAWRRHGNRIQIMDPASGRRWLTWRQFLTQLYIHVMPVPAMEWRAWAATDDFLLPLRFRLSRIGASKPLQDRLLEQAFGDPGWMGFGAVDAATRMTQSIVHSRGLRPGRQAVSVLESFFRRSRHAEKPQETPIPTTYWSILAAEPAPELDQQVLIKGAVMVRVKGCRKETSAEHTPLLSAELKAALAEPPTRPGRALLGLFLTDGLLTPTRLLIGLLFSGAAAVALVILARALIDLVSMLQAPEQRLVGILALAGLSMLVMLLELPIFHGMLQMGRQLENRLRLAFLKKLPRLSDQYFRSRLASDMVERSHSIHAVRTLPETGGQLLRLLFHLLFVAAGMIWLDPHLALLVLVVVVVSNGIPIVMQPQLIERDLRLRTHAGALTRFYLDSLLGLVPLRSHGAERAIRREHDSLLEKWMQASFRLLKMNVGIEAIMYLGGFGLAAVLIYNHMSRVDNTAGLLLLTFWALQVPALGSEIALNTRRYPEFRNLTLRLVEPLGAPEKRLQATQAQNSIPATQGKSVESLDGVQIYFDRVSVQVPGQTILKDIHLNIQPGDHLAIVGPSGAGKSSLVGLLLGWHYPSSGVLMVDGQLLDDERLTRLRKEIAWMDPAIQLWNRTLLFNIGYGAPADSDWAIDSIVNNAQLQSVFKTLPDGLQASLGEGGNLVSGGEGQRVRLARGLVRSQCRLVILDEPFRGLDRRQRRSLLKKTREYWPNATLLCITHDVSETQSFERVVVMEKGRIVEDEKPAVLSKRPDSRYATMLRAELTIQNQFRSGSLFRRFRLEEGRLVKITQAKGEP